MAGMGPSPHCEMQILQCPTRFRKYQDWECTQGVGGGAERRCCMENSSAMQTENLRPYRAVHAALNSLVAWTRIMQGLEKLAPQNDSQSSEARCATSNNPHPSPTLLHPTKLIAGLPSGVPS